MPNRTASRDDHSTRQVAYLKSLTFTPEQLEASGMARGKAEAAARAGNATARQAIAELNRRRAKTALDAAHKQARKAAKAELEAWAAAQSGGGDAA